MDGPFGWGFATTPLKHFSIKNSNLQKLRDSLETSYDPKPATPKESSSLDASFLLLGSPPPSLGRVPLHPQPVQIFKLWQTFLDNVNPLSKVIHAPTLQVKILDATGNLDNLQPNMEALLFAIYTTAICSLSSDECEIIMGEPKTKLFPRFLTATEQALSKASFLESSDLMLLQAFVLLLVFYIMLCRFKVYHTRLTSLFADSNETNVQSTLAVGFDGCCDSNWPKDGTTLRWQVAWLVNIRGRDAKTCLVANCSRQQKCAAIWSEELGSG